MIQIMILVRSHITSHVAFIMYIIIECSCIGGSDCLVHESCHESYHESSQEPCHELCHFYHVY